MIYKLLYLSRKGLFLCHASLNQVERLKKKKKIYFKIRRGKFSLKEQLEIFEFLSLYYSEGENVYHLLLKYQQFADKKIKGICGFILGELRRGKEVSQIFKDSQLFSEDINSFFLISKMAGTNKITFEKIVSVLRTKLKNQKELLKRSIYPAMLLFSGLSMIVFVSYSIIPNFLFFFQDSGTEIPLLLRLISRENLWKLALLIIVVVIALYLLYKVIPLKAKASIPIVNYFYRARFQLLFWQLCIISTESGVSLEELIGDYLTLEKKGLSRYSLSTILSRLTRGLPFDQSIDIPLIERKQRVLSTMATDNQRKQQLYQNFLLEAEEKNNEAQIIIANLVSSLALVFIGILILVLGYVMLIPLRQISEIV
ncbi:MAG: hypothetical protein WCH76_04405 [Candidatus Riflemargulisbacteria bacterium]